jgi:anhydro-N-acetylmuramic acid kinase
MIVIGLISGTSADGMDAALCEITGEPPHLQARIVQAMTRPYRSDVRDRVLAACHPVTGSVDMLCQLNFDLAEHFAETTLQLIEQASIGISEVDLIGSHGQTVWHSVLADGHVNATLQLTEASVLAERTGITTVSNFRSRDIAAGGQGAPLTSYADWLLLRHADHWRAVQNIGGIGNVTLLPPLADSASSPLAFDTGPGNVLIDAAIHKITEGVQTFDRDGIYARQGKVDAAWLEQLLQHPYYALRPPKTTGRELFSTNMASLLVEEGYRRGLEAADILATLTALTAHTIADAYRRFAPAVVAEVVLGGGGHSNPVLVEMLQALLQPVPVLSHEDIGLNSDYKEALVFALLAYETWHARPGNLPSMTGAGSPVVLGQITPGRNYANLVRKTWCRFA